MLFDEAQTVDPLDSWREWKKEHSSFITKAFFFAILMASGMAWYKYQFSPIYFLVGAVVLLLLIFFYAIFFPFIAFVIEIIKMPFELVFDKFSIFYIAKWIIIVVSITSAFWIITNMFFLVTIK